MASNLLGAVSWLTNYLTTNPVHPTYYPFLWITTLHAARISLAFRSRVNALGNSNKLGRGPEYTGFLIMCWGGSFLSHSLLSLPPPQILSVNPTLNYISTHFILNLILDTFGSPSSKTLDTFLPLIDAILRTGSICSSVNLVAAHANPSISSSLFLQLLIGATASGGSSAIASSLSVWNTQWSFGTPPFLRGGILDTLDIWSGSLAAAVYGVLLALHPAYESYTRFLSRSGEAYIAGTPLMSPLEARSVSVIVLTLLYSYRVYKTHYVAAKAPVKITVTPAVKEKDL